MGNTLNKSKRKGKDEKEKQEVRSNTKKSAGESEEKGEGESGSGEVNEVEINLEGVSSSVEVTLEREGGQEVSVKVVGSLWGLIVSFSEPTTIGRLSRVCKSLYKLTKEEKVWKKCVEKRYGEEIVQVLYYLKSIIDNPFQRFIRADGLVIVFFFPNIHSYYTKKELRKEPFFYEDFTTTGLLYNVRKAYKFR